MELESIQEELITVVKGLSLKVNFVDFYLFGSFLLNPRSANDIDILIIYENKNQIKVIKKDFENLSKEFPLHMNYFTHKEEKELNFIKTQRAKKILEFSTKANSEIRKK
ncbi:hypothetical protein B0A79_01955 [Flavobacterium piscis]|uniref:Polymerase nucleotidyl transferase domain-containing protein n=1 Tax=Flavobacterium piscis TaxID=1114874 RepID=A0ABX2XN47_9FLAO|nr:nucleotidyltransferase domain-containing protein [Flavobacterium piscis]OCB77158.1 hypothetical protein FLP_04240 [Flavobacterium piscis]OXG07795.1 hypothetical protein B0A79_01955 [Flavobacterium piscis]